MRGDVGRLLQVGRGRDNREETDTDAGTVLVVDEYGVSWLIIVVDGEDWRRLLNGRGYGRGDD